MTELRLIAATLVEGHTCDTLLDIAKAKLINRDSLITEKNFEINHLNEIITLHDQLVRLKEAELKDVNLKLKKEVRRHKFTKLGWGATTVTLAGALVYFIIN